MRAWNLAGGLDWQALDTLCELYGIDDPHMLIAQLEAIRDWQAGNRG